MEKFGILFLKIFGIFCIFFSIYAYLKREETIQYLMRRYARVRTKSEFEAAYEAFKFRTFVIIIMSLIAGILFLFFTKKLFN